MLEHAAHVSEGGFVPVISSERGGDEGGDEDAHGEHQEQAGDRLPGTPDSPGLPGWARSFTAAARVRRAPTLAIVLRTAVSSQPRRGNSTRDWSAILFSR